MKKYYQILAASVSVIALFAIGFACVKDVKTATVTPPTPTSPVPTGSFTEEFDDVSTLTSKGWVFKNNSDPVGITGWRQGRYEPANVSGQKKFLAPVDFVGFPAYSASKTPNDFISCDITAANDINNTLFNAQYNVWLISPPVPMKNGDKISFWTRALDDSQYPVFLSDQVQVRLNTSDATPNVGADTAVGKFDRVLLDINPDHETNDPASGSIHGYPLTWTNYTITLSGLPAAGITTRFAFRYVAKDAGVFGGASAANYPGVVGIDKLTFTHN